MLYMISCVPSCGRAVLYSLVASPAEDYGSNGPRERTVRKRLAAPAKIRRIKLDVSSGEERPCGQKNQQAVKIIMGPWVYIYLSLEHGKSLLARSMLNISHTGTVHTGHCED